MRISFRSLLPVQWLRQWRERRTYINRKGNDSDRFLKAAQNITGKRVTYSQLTGKEPAGYETSH